MNTLTGLNVLNKTVLVRVDFNTPICKNGLVADEARIRSHLPTIKSLRNSGAKVVLMSHLGADGSNSLKEIAVKLGQILNAEIQFSPRCIGPERDKQIKALKASEILLLENTRQYVGEKKNDKKFAKDLSKKCDIFINDAFATSHRAHASTVGVTQFFKPDNRAVGRLMEQELSTLEYLLESPDSPFLVIIGGAKVSSKLGVLSSLIHKADEMMIGGAMANTFLAAQGIDIGASFHEAEMIPKAREILKEAKAANCKIHLPTDLIIASSIDDVAGAQTVSVNEIPEDKMALDIGAETASEWENIIDNVRTVLWNGPVGVFETKPFNKGTFAIAEKLGRTKVFSMAGGGDTLHALANAGMENKINYTSTAGGALLEFLEGKELPAITVLHK